MIKSFAFILLLLVGGISVFGQTPGVRPSTWMGDVVSISSDTIVLKTAEAEVTIKLTETTEFKRVPADRPSLTAAVPSTVSEIGIGDRLVVTGFPADDKRSMPARAVYVMTRSDIDQKAKQEAERWATRGISGRVAATNPNTFQITLEVRGLMGTQNVIISPKAEVKYLRYAPDSVKYSEALNSQFAEIEAGDMLRALGDRSPDGISFAAEEIVTGAFQTLAGTVKSVDVEKNEIVIADMQTEKEIVVAVGPGSALKRFPEEMALRMVMPNGAPGGTPGTPAAGGARPGGPPAGAPPGGQQGGMARPGGGAGGRGGIDDMFERFPSITAGELKIGDMIAISSSRNGKSEKVTAIKLLAGIEPFVRAAQMQAAAGGQRGRGAQTGGFTIPGLDGFDFP
jgi:hypothetical protein